MGSKVFRFHPVNAWRAPVRFYPLERFQEVLSGEHLLQQVVACSVGLIVGSCRRHALLSRRLSRLHRCFLRVGPCLAWLLSLHASRTHQDESSLSRSALPLGELAPRYYGLC